MIAFTPLPCPHGMETSYVFCNLLPSVPASVSKPTTLVRIFAVAEAFFSF